MMNRNANPDPSEKRADLERIYEEARRLEAELAGEEAARLKATWPPAGYYTPFHVLVGAMLGFVGASSSLLFNVVGSLLSNRHPLELIRVYLTFPLAEQALKMDSGVALGIGTCLYLVTGSGYGVLFHLVMSRWFPKAARGRRFAVATAIGLGLWIVNFYGVLSWLQPMVFGGNWIVRMVPFWVAASTHLVFAWTMLLIEQWGEFIPYSPRS